MPLVSASLSTSPPTKPARSSLANLWETGLPVGGEVSGVFEGMRWGGCVVELWNPGVGD